jgi:hypothetical protein
MSRFTRRSRFAGLAAASLLVLAAAAAPVRAQTPPAHPPEPALVDDSLVNGGLIGLGVGFGVGFVTAGFLTLSCDVRNCTPLSGPEFTAVTAAGAGIGLLTGLLINKARRDPPPVAVAIRADRQVRAVRIDWRLGKTAATQVPAPRPRPRPRYFDDSRKRGAGARDSRSDVPQWAHVVGNVHRRRRRSPKLPEGPRNPLSQAIRPPQPRSSTLTDFT